MQVADQYVTGGRYEEAKAFADTAKRIDLHCDTWGFWEKQFQKAEGNDPTGAWQVLKLMVQGEEAAERRQKAIGLYNDLKHRHSEVPPPPLEIRAIIDATEFRQLLADAEQSVKNGDYKGARTKLDDASNRYPTLWSSDEKAHTIDEDVRFQLALEAVREAWTHGDSDTAEGKLKEATQIRPENKEALALWHTIRQERVKSLIEAAKIAFGKKKFSEAIGLLRKANDILPDDAKIQTMLDKAEVGQHRREAENAITTENLRGAVDEIHKAREILERPSNASWSTPGSSALDELAKTVVGRLHEQAVELSGKRQYREAKRKIDCGLRLSPTDEKLLELLKKVKELETDPATASISGKWASQDGTEMTLDDTGTDTIAFRSPNWTGSFTRKGASLEAKTTTADGDLTVKAKIEGCETIVVYLRTLVPRNSRQKGGTDHTRYSWTRQGGGADELQTPGDTEEPSVRPPRYRPAPQRNRKTHQNPFGSRTNSDRGLHSQDANGFAARPLENGVITNDLSIAIVRPITKNGDAAEITLGFRRIGGRSEGHDWMTLSVHDDRSNEYTSQNFSLDGGGGSLKGRPPAVKQLPVGFTWVSRIEVQMPGIAIGHIAKVELSQGLFGGQKHLLDFQNSGMPSLEFRIPADRLLSPGEKLPLDKNLVAEIGELAAGGSRGGSLSLPISVINEDYNPHPCESFKLYVQSENGEVWEYSTIGERSGWSSEEIPGKTTKKLSSALADSDSRGSLSEGLHAVLLYRSPEGILSEPRFCGFIPIPDDVRKRMRRNASE